MRKTISAFFDSYFTSDFSWSYSTVLGTMFEKCVTGIVTIIGLCSDTRIAFVVIFYGGTILSYLLLPEGFLLKKNSVADFNTSKNVIVCAVQIFLYNMLLYYELQVL